MTEAMEFSNQVAKCDLLPDHLKDKPANCLRVAMQSMEWKMNFFAVADKTSVIKGKVMYEGQLVSAVVNSCGNLKRRLDYKFAETKDRTLTVTGTLQGEDEPRTIELTYEQACKINQNGQMAKNPQQQMCYIGARIWARRHMPELMMGVYGDDEHIEDGDPENDGEDKPARPKPPAKNKGAAAAKREMKVAEKIEEEAKAEAEDPEIVDDEPEAKKEESKKSDPKPAEKEPEAKPEPKPKEKTKEPEPKKQAKKEPATALEVGQVIQATFAVEKVNPKKDKSGNPLLELTIRGDDYAGIAYSKDVENELLNSEGVAELKIKGVNTPSGKVLVLVDSASEAVNF